MFDPFLLLTPILVLAVLALIRFVGCDQVLGLEPPTLRRPPRLPLISRLLTARRLSL